MSELTKNAIIYMPDGEVRAVFHILHGMAEYQGRYREFAHFLAEHGFAVVTSDLRGHGINTARETELGFFGDNAVSRLVGDVHDITQYIKDHFPHIPCFLFGHGIGALLATVYIKKYDNYIDGLFLCGMPADKPLRPAADLLTMVLMAMRGEYHRSSLLNYLIMGSYYRPFAREGSEFAWLSSDRDSVLKYEINPKCGYIYTINGFKTILDLMNRTYTKGSWIKKHTGLPIRLFWGEEDSCAAGKNGVLKTVHLFSDNGYTDVGYIIYPGQRHELFQDFCREKIWQDLLEQVESCLAAIPDVPDKAAATPKHIVLEDFVDPEIDRPMVRDEKLNLEEYIDKDAHPKVEMIDFADIEAVISGAGSEESSASSDSEGSTPASQKTPPEEEFHPLDDFDGFKIDPNITDGL